MMESMQLLDLDGCTEFRQRLEAKTMPAASMVMVALFLLFGAAVVWAMLAKASLVVIAEGRVRPTQTPNRIYSAVSPYLEGRVAEVFVTEGDEVRQGDVLLRLDTSLIDNEIAKQTYAIRSGRSELAQLHKLQELLDERTRVARERANAQLQQLLAEHERKVNRQASEIRRAEAVLAKSRDLARRTRILFDKKVAVEASLVEVQAELSQDQEVLVQAQLKLDDGAIVAGRQALQLVDRDHSLKYAELAAKIAVREGEVQAVEKELATRQYERRHAELRAPIDGVLVTGNVKVGDVLKSGEPVFEVAREDALRFEAQVSSEDVGELHEGMPVELKLNAFNFQKFGTIGGTVCYISPDSHLADVAAGGKAYYQVKIDLEKLQIGRGDLSGQVKLGMAGVAEIVTARENLLAIFSRQMRRSIRIE